MQSAHTTNAKMPRNGCDFGWFDEKKRRNKYSRADCSIWNARFVSHMSCGNETGIYTYLPTSNNSISRSYLCCYQEIGHIFNVLLAISCYQFQHRSTNSINFVPVDAGRVWCLCVCVHIFYSSTPAEENVK